MKARATDGLPIREAAARFGLATHVLRHWEDVGLLAPERDASGSRRYSAADLVSVAIIARNKGAGMTLRQIRALIDGSVPDRHAVLEEHLRQLDERAAEINRSRMMTEHALGCTAHDITACPRFAAMLEDVIEGTAAWNPAGPDMPR